MSNAYAVKNPDYRLSPLTGMGRQHYIDCAKYVLERAFTHVNSLEQPIVFPTIPGSKSYPQPTDPAWRSRSHEFEALERTFNLAAYRKRTSKNPPMELMISVMLHKNDNTSWSHNVLNPIKEIVLRDVMPSGSVIGAELTLHDDTRFLVDFKDIDGFKSC